MAESSKSVTVAIGANLIVAGAKFVASVFTGSSSMLAEGVHSVVDAANDGLLILGQHAREREPDADHPFGYGKEQYFWTVIVAMIIFALGGGISIFEGVTHLVHPEPIEKPIWNYAVLVVAFLADGYSWSVAFRQLRSSRGEKTILQAARASKDPSLFTVWFEDSAALVGVGLAFLGVLLSHVTGSGYPDAIASVLIGITMGATAGLLIYESRKLLIGETADSDIIAGIRSIAESEGCVAFCGPPLTMHLGPEDVLVNLDVQFHPGLTADAIFDAVDRMESGIRGRFTEVRRIFIEPERLRHTDGQPTESPRSSAGLAKAGTVACPSDRGPEDY